MKKLYRTYAFIGWLAGIAALTGYLYMQRSGVPELPEAPKIQGETAQTSKPDDAAVFTTPEEKIAQLMAAPLDLKAQTASIASQLIWDEQYSPGFVVLFGTDVSADQATAAISRLDEMYQEYPAGVSVAVDHEGGTVQRLSGTGFTRLPSWQQSCSSPPGTQHDVFGKSSLELAMAGVDIVFAPVIDLSTGNSALKTRACKDPDAIFATASEYITTMRSAEIEPVLKHFPGIGSVSVDTHKQFAALAPVALESQLFTSLLDTFPNLSVMIAHVGLTTQDPTVPCTVSANCVGALTVNYADSLLFSDALEMSSAVYRPAPLPEKPLPQVAQEALLAGVEVLVFGPEVSPAELTKVHAFLVSEYQSSPTFRAAVDQHLQKVMAYKKRAGFVR